MGELIMERYFSREAFGQDKTPYDMIDWKKVNAEIKGEDGRVVFVQKDVEIPMEYSQLAANVLFSKYAYGEQGTSERENSMRDLVSRISETYGNWAVVHKYMDTENAEIEKDELALVLLGQKASFNSPVWFNVGTERYDSRKSNDSKTMFIYNPKKEKIIQVPRGQSHRYPQTSACFIQSVGDTMEEIMELLSNEAMLFKFGSGTGTDLSTLRSSREKLSGGGRPSGPLPYMTVFDRNAGVVKSGGKTRRAAKMQSLKTDHPDIMEFIGAKSREEEIIKTLINNGHSYETASERAFYQNLNTSIRASDDFMRAVENDEMWQTKAITNTDDEMPKYSAREMMKALAEATWNCGDPGMQFDDTINGWHTVPNSGRINASNPCSEYMNVDDSSCNLASLNLMKFKRDDGIFDIESFGRVIGIMVPPMDLNYANSSFPTKKIAENSHRFRPLGLGYSNLGALIMSEALSYDSDEARALTGAVTALLTGYTFLESSKMAKELGPFEAFEENKEPMLKVMEKHRDALYGANENVDFDKLPGNYDPVLDEAKKVWDQVLTQGRQYGFRNSQATVLAPTGTISFGMDCDTTGIEPDVALVKYKQLAGGGNLKMVNQIVPSALEKLGYDEGEIESIVMHIEKTDGIEGSVLKDEHLPVFDCAYKSPNGERSLSPMSHLKMMAVAQPFLSGAISKTVSLTKETTPEQIEELYMDSWKMGLKAVAMYRDGSKTDQPMTTGGKGKLENRISPAPAERVKLPHTRYGPTHKFAIGGHDVYLNVGEYPDGKPGELFVTMAKEGSTMSGIMDAFGTSVSMALQSGVSMETYVKKFIGADFPPRGRVDEGDRENIKTAKSIIDYMFRWLGHQYVEGFGQNGEVSLENGNGGLESIVPQNSGNVHGGKGNPEPKGVRAGIACETCGNLDYTYKLRDCVVLCDSEMGGCGTRTPGGCEG